MRSILDKIVAFKKQEVLEVQGRTPVASLEKTPGFKRSSLSLRASLLSGQGVIAEIKRKSPSKGLIKSVVSVEYLAAAYEAAGVSAISILTDREYFGGSADDLAAARHVVGCPILRKEFIVDEYQVIESKSIGADAILLMASVLSATSLKRLSRLARDFGLEVLTEAHNEKELEACLSVAPDVVGVNNRDLRDFTVSLDVSHRLAALIPPNLCKISESGIYTVADAIALRRARYDGFLIGQAFMEQEWPAAYAKDFVHGLRKAAERRELA